MKKLMLCTLVAASIASTTVNADILGPSEEEIGRIAADYLIKNPEVLVEVSEALKAKEMDKINSSMIEGALKYKNKLLDNNTPYVGNAEGKVAIIQFFDYQCGFCQKLSPVMSELQASNPDVKLVMKETPIFAQRSEVSGYAAQMGLKIFAQGGSEAYGKYHNAIFEKALSGSALTNKGVDRQVEVSGLELSSLPKEDSKAVMENLKLFSELGFQGTPAVVVMPIENPTVENTSVIRGADIEGIKAALVKAQTASEPASAIYN
ncbi:DsbA family protein [Psychromonas aquimarina]|uniref:DsbA family protein n=1 Tax=Psychromonas aquimarina TaxID=444919 RepID=UPI0003F523E9|nr:DsbA family protein [Psychromonas aquimarina]